MYHLRQWFNAWSYPSVFNLAPTSPPKSGDGVRLGGSRIRNKGLIIEPDQHAPHSFGEIYYPSLGPMPDKGNTHVDAAWGIQQLRSGLVLLMVFHGKLIGDHGRPELLNSRSQVRCHGACAVPLVWFTMFFFLYSNAMHLHAFCLQPVSVWGWGKTQMTT